MDPVPPTFPGSPSRQQSRRACKTHRGLTRRRAVSVVLVVVVLAVAGYGIYRLVDNGNLSKTNIASPEQGSAGAGGNAWNSPPITPNSGIKGLSSDTSTSALNSGSPDTTDAELTSSAETSNLAPEEITITANPEIVKLAITLQDGTIINGKTPLSQKVPGGKVRIEFSKNGYNTTTREFLLDKPTKLKVWLDPEGQIYQSLVRFKCGPNPKQVVFTPDGEEMWVSLLGGYGLEIFEPTTGTKIGGVKLGDYGAVEIIFTRSGQTAYASQMETASVYEIDRATRTIKRQFKTGGTWTKVLALSPDEKTLWASNWVSNDVSEIDLSTGEVARIIKTVVTPRGLYVTPDGNRLFVAGFENGDVQRIDLATGKSKILFKTGGAMRHMVGDESRGVLYADDMSTKEVFVIDLSTEKVTKLADTDERPNTMDLSPDGRVLYISNRGKDNPKTYYIPGPEWGSILAIDTATGRILDAIVGGNQCTGLDVSPDGTLLAFSDFLDNKIRVYKIPDYEVLAAGDGGRADAHLKDIIKN